MKVVYTPTDPNVYGDITPNKLYELVKVYPKEIPVYTIKNDKGQIKSYLSKHFTDINTWRENLLNKIIE